VRVAALTTRQPPAHCRMRRGGAFTRRAPMPLSTWNGSDWSRAGKYSKNDCPCRRHAIRVSACILQSAQNKVGERAYGRERDPVSRLPAASAPPQGRDPGQQVSGRTRLPAEGRDLRATPLPPPHQDTSGALLQLLLDHIDEMEADGLHPGGAGVSAVPSEITRGALACHIYPLRRLDPAPACANRTTKRHGESSLPRRASAPGSSATRSRRVAAIPIGKALAI